MMTVTGRPALQTAKTALRFALLVDISAVILFKLTDKKIKILNFDSRFFLLSLFFSAKAHAQHQTPGGPKWEGRGGAAEVCGGLEVKGS